MCRNALIALVRAEKGLCEGTLLAVLCTLCDPATMRAFLFQNFGLSAFAYVTRAGAITSPIAQLKTVHCVCGALRA